MHKFRLDSHKEAKHFGSTNIIVDSINNAAKKIELFSDRKDDFVFYYDTLADDHGEKADAIYVAYELPFPKLIIDRLAGRPVLGLSKDNAFFATLAGYPIELVHYASMGVDSGVWYYTQKKYKKDKFVFLSMCESNTRSGFEVLVPAFCEAFKGSKGVELLIKDREATDTFKSWIKEMSVEYDVTITHDDRHIANFEEQVKYYESADVQVVINHSHTWGMVISQGMSCGLPTMTQRFSGPSDYCTSLNSLSLNHSIQRIDNNLINGLMNIGLKNHLIPITEEQYPNGAFWSQVDKDYLKEQLLNTASLDKNTLHKFSILSRQTALWFSWENTANTLSYLVNKINNQKVETLKDRYVP